ncbi:tRNA (5-methylaminomethyl-2-thiouridine)(34)-methyltransferase MnmD [Meridianimaribacter flavus]|uniref:tRNA U34 5-methylaminomethyl-2-thiouridine-forming methyltransferase MnmC n=1 Tax=Meridianimaribacter flavus TaxID=571115 RepID=A0ABY2G3Y9_9FLAO|nr:tRNA (5-methylaminomethyl-2-thiouridine)(34)-methyltransferase MnmD [Meridianimaribacter flavus]TDY07603.1 tRNA U34 5-methylaminomethyl-2-thiouridine-forming methyltransferase MnmC [Meridianimaribacter flavus]
MKRKIITTADGSKTIQIEDWNEQYHSVHGAIQEAMHVFILHGLFCFLDSHKPISILEIGFGTGLNAFITLLESEKSNLHINYTGVEAYPVTQEEVDALNYTEQLKTNNTLFSKLHQCDWEVLHHITPKFSLTKQQKFFKDIDAVAEFDLIYFDAFGARVQPELWTETVFELMYKALKPKGVLVTYSAKGSVRRAMQTVGFSVEKLPGPPGKREMLRATKLEV